MEGLIEGRIVHFVRDTHRARLHARTLDLCKEPDPAAGTHEAAIVSDVIEPDAGTVNLHVFSRRGGYEPHTSVPYSATPLPRTWHWIERA